MKNQMKTNIKILAAGLLAFTMSNSALASLAIPNGWYLEGNVGASKLSDTNINGSVSSSGLGANVNAGYKFMPYLSGEIGYTYYGNVKIKDQFDTKAADNRHYSYDLAAKGVVPIVATGLEAFAKLGVQRTVSKISIQNSVAAANISLDSKKHSDTGLYMGLGAQYYFTPELAGILQWARAKNDSSTGTMDLYSAGLSIIFE